MGNEAREEERDIVDEFGKFIVEFYRERERLRAERERKEAGSDSTLP